MVSITPGEEASMNDGELTMLKKIFKLYLMSLVFFFFLLFTGCGTPGTGELTKGEQRLNLESFEQVWTTIHDKHYDPTLGGLNWQGVHDELLVKMKKARNMSEARAVLNNMISRLDQSHFAIIPGSVYEGINQPGENDNLDYGMSGIDIRVIGNQALVTGVEKDSPACAAGVKSGWAILKVGPTDISPLLNSISQQYEKKTWKSLMLTFAIKALLIGEIGESLAIRFSDQYDLTVEKKIVLAKPRGKIFRLGYFDFGYVWCEKKMLAGNIGYIAFNGFLDVSRVMPVFNNAVKEFMKARGIIIDIRGNPGGLGFMSTGMAGWFIEKKGLSLGTLITRDNRLKFAILPRPEVYTGRLAILVDRVSASTSEIFAAGLQALGRARIFGEITAGAALPSIFVMLPNGDAFQYAYADYHSVSGNALEGHGVVPDQEISLTREALLQGKDPGLEAAIQWIRSRENKHKQ
jgi:carboxyl-terminal processing protease